MFQLKRRGDFFGAGELPLMKLTVMNTQADGGFLVPAEGIIKGGRGIEAPRKKDDGFLVHEILPDHFDGREFLAQESFADGNEIAGKVARENPESGLAFFGKEEFLLI